MFDVISIGSAYLDIFVKSSQFKLIKNKQFASGVALCEAYGAKIEVDDITLATGGGATNSAVSFARKNLKTACIAETGKDLLAEMISNELIQEQVDSSFLVQESNEKTAISVIMVASEGGRSIISYRGAAGMLTHKDIPWEKLNTKWLYITSLGGHLDLLNELISYANDKGIKVALNPGSKELKFKKQIQEIGNQVEVLVLNLDEATEYLDLQIDKTEDILQAIKQYGGHTNLITLGPHGAYVVNEKSCYFCPPADKSPVDTTGAGDAFGSGFVAGLILELSFEKSIQLALSNASSVISYTGAKDGLINLDKFNQWQDLDIKLVNL